MPDVQNKNKNLIVLNFCQYTVIPNAVTPLPATVCCQTFSVLARVFTPDEIFPYPTVN